jgi:hypothetical protein
MEQSAPSQSAILSSASQSTPHYVNQSASMTPNKKPDTARLDRIVAEARKSAEQREMGYRERALQMYPWICTRCTREFTRTNLQQLTVHHRDHNHDNNPPDGSNWELLCLYCHDNEHSRYLEADRQGPSGQSSSSSPQAATHNPFAALEAMLKKKQ